MVELPPHGRLSYSSHGEDRVLFALFDELGGVPERGVYVDVGAYHPIAVSNTALLYQAGWRGINIEPNPAMVALIEKDRPDDVTLRQAAGTPRRTAELLFFGDWASSNTLDPAFADMISTDQNVPIERTISTEVVPLVDVLGQHLGQRPLDFLTVDVEGMDLEVLQSSDWSTYRPSVVAVEDLDLQLGHAQQSSIYRFLAGVGYRLVSHAVKTSFYVEE